MNTTNLEYMKIRESIKKGCLRPFLNIWQKKKKTQMIIVFQVNLLLEIFFDIIYEIHKKKLIA